VNADSLLKLVLYLGTLTALAVPLGEYMARVYTGRSRVARSFLGSLESFLYRVSGVQPDVPMNWKSYGASFLVFNLLGMVALYALLRLQAHLPLNPAALGPVAPEIAFNTAVSFATNTNWQAYSGETTLSHLTQMLGLTVQNFLSAAAGICVLVALIRGFERRASPDIGNFWVDLVRSVLYVLLPLSTLLAVALAAQGVVQTFATGTTVQLLEPLRAQDGSILTTQTLALGPAASQIAIKQLGTNGGGFFNVNSAHPFENPTPFAGVLESLAILLIPAALCFTFGAMVRDRRQGAALFAAMMVLFVPLLVGCVVAEQAGNPLLGKLGIDQASSELQSGGNMEGKEVRFGAFGSALWATATAASSNGSVNAMHDSFTPLGGLVPMLLIQLGEVVFGGVGSGLYGMILFVIVTVFIAGLMVGRTPEYLGHKLEAFEMKMAALGILVPAAAVLVGTAIACLTPEGRSAVANPGPHGFSEILYAFSSGANNNGSAFAGLNAGSFFYTTAIGVCMLVGRYWTVLPVLAIAGSLAIKKAVPASAGTLPTHTPLFVLLLASTVLLVGALTFIPALALGPLAEHLRFLAR